jgi:integrase
LKETSDGFVLSGLSANKYGDRSDAVGKRFGRLKTDLGFGDAYVFHSIRKTVTTLLENAGVPENVAADIVGHEKPRITYGLYSGGNSLEVKRKAIEKLSYPL